ncbi:MAG: septum formation initiator family protein [Patescibacteria group bacterium]|nr:septum formation initiator family protein [Patescibacteria group bacterium]
MKNQSQNFNLARIIVIFGFAIVAYMLYSLTVSIYENYQIDVHIENFQSKNDQLQTENLEKLESYKYYTSDMYIEKVAKQNLGLINPGEQVIVITEDDNNTILEAEYEEAKNFVLRNTWSNSRKWWEFFFGENPFKY